MAAQGAEVAKGDLNDPASLAVALQGVTGVFSMQRPDMDGSDSERRQGLNLIKAARDAGVRHYVHSSVCQAGTHESFPKWNEGYWSKKYWTDKWDVEEAVRGAGFEAWTILRPSFIMENFTNTKAQFLYPQLRQSVILTPVKPQARVQLIASADIGAFANAAFENPERFNGETIELAGDDMNMADVGRTLGENLGKHIEVRSVSPDEALTAGIAPTWVRSQEWINDVGYQIDTTLLAGYDVPMTSFADWVRRNADQILVDG